jgi:enterobactin synthetase component D
MRAMNLLPACCTAPQSRWPFAVPLAGAWLFSNRFVPSELADDDFARSGIDAPPSLQRSVAKRRAEFLAGRLCARAALQQLGSDLVSPQQAHAAPGLGEDRAPIWPLQVSGSITHSDGWAAAIAAPHSAWRGLGLDAETLLDGKRAERLAGEILTPAELQRLDALPAEQRAQRITLTFSIKESLFKALYPLVLKRFYFEHAEVLDWSDPGRVRLRLLTELSDEFRQGSEFTGQFCELDGRVLTLVYL